MTTDITELAQSLKRRATSANEFGESLYVKGDDVLALVEALEKAQTINAAAEKLVRCKGRYHSEQNYRALAALFGVTTPDLPPLDVEPVGEVIEVGDALLVEWHKNLEEGAKLYTTPKAPVMPFGLHPDTQKLVTDFCAALAEKLYKAQLKYGYDADWKQDGWQSQCQAHFHQHIAKGDPRDVAAYCAFMWWHGWSTKPAEGLESRTVTPVNYSENADADYCRKWAWEQVKGEVSMEDWTTGDSITYFGFFCWGWDMRRQYNEQRPINVKLPKTMYTEFDDDDYCREVAVLDKQQVIDCLAAAGIKVEDE